ncbi:MAG: ABC transporter substrate-binding protein [Burkholderiales bacterium]|nr:ABC transporter substrate-binding protein [Burkholderiales bacterium]
MRRRGGLFLKYFAFIALLLGTVTSWALAPAQGSLKRIGFLANSVPQAEMEAGTATHPAVTEFVTGLRKLGWIDGKNVRIVWKSAEGEYGRLPQLAEELAGMPVDVIVAFGGGVNAAARATRTIPVVMVTYYSPVEEGLAASLARPGGNVTGTVLVAGGREQHNEKRLSLLKEAVPRIARIAFVTLWKGPVSGRQAVEARIEEAFRRSPALSATTNSLGLEVSAVTFATLQDMPAAIERAARAGAQALWFDDVPELHYPDAQAMIASEARRHRLPDMHQVLGAAANGGFMAFGSDITANYRRAPHFVDRILRGQAPADMPIEQPSRVELHVNRGAARALGIELPPSLLLRADRVFD